MAPDERPVVTDIQANVAVMHTATDATSSTGTLSPDSHIQAFIRKLPAFAGAVAIAIGAVILAGFALGPGFLPTFMPGQVAVKANTAAGLIAGGIALLALQWARRRAAAVVVWTLASFNLVVSLATLLEYIIGLDLGLDQILFREATGLRGTTHPGRMAPQSALCFVLTAGALLLLTSQRRRHRLAAQLLGALGGIIGLLALLGYTFNITGLYDLGQHAWMAFPAALGFCSLAVGIAFATTDCGFMAPLAAHGGGGMMLRRMLPLAILVPWITGWLAAVGTRRGFYGGDTDDVLFAAALMIIFSAVLYANARALNRIDAERENTQEVLRRSSEQWQLTFDCMSEGLSYHDVDYNIVGSNAAFRKLVGDASPEGQKCYNAVHCTAGPHEDCPMQRTLRSGQSEESEIYEPHLGKHLLVRTDPVKNKAGNVFRVVHVVEDITARKKAEEHIRRFAAIVEQSFDAIFSADLNGCIISWNRAAEQIYGYSSAEAIGSSLSILCPPEASTEWMEIQSKVREGIRVENVERIRVRKDGDRFYASLTVSPMRDVAGNIVGCSAVARDITETKRAEAEIARRGAEAQRARAELSAVVDSMGEGLYQLDSDARVVFMNSACERMLGYTLEEIRGRKMHDVIHSMWPDGRSRAAQECPLVRVVKSGDSHHEDEDFFRRRDGSFFPVEYTSSPLIVGGKIAGAVLSFRDISERKRAEEERSRLLALERQARRELEIKKTEVEQLNTELEERVRTRTVELEVANKELEAFSYSVSHDLRAPLRSLDGFSHILLDEYAERLDEEGRDFLRRLRNASQNMGQLIDALLQLSRVTRSEMSREQVDLTAIARQIVEELKKTAPERQVDIHIAEGLVAKGDPRLVHVALLNLLGNAWKFTARREHAMIEFGLGQREGVPTFFVKDNGAGFDMNYGNKLFGAFQRLHTAAEFEGSGIGLATVQRIVRRHGGNVWAEGTPGQGATFYFTLA